MKIYDILMNTPLEKKKGELKAEKFTVFLSLFGHTEPIEGTRNCSLKKKFITILQSADFTADGTIDCDTLPLTINGDCGYYEIMGQRHCQECDIK